VRDGAPCPKARALSACLGWARAAGQGPACCLPLRRDGAGVQGLVRTGAVLRRRRTPSTRT
jgi:hypothetical protein